MQQWSNVRFILQKFTCCLLCVGQGPTGSWRKIWRKFELSESVYFNLAQVQYLLLMNVRLSKRWWFPGFPDNFYVPELCLWGKIDAAILFSCRRDSLIQRTAQLDQRCWLQNEVLASWTAPALRLCQRRWPMQFKTHFNLTGLQFEL